MVTAATAVEEFSSTRCERSRSSQRRQPTALAVHVVASAGNKSHRWPISDGRLNWRWSAPSSFRSRPSKIRSYMLPAQRARGLQVKSHDVV